MVKKQRYVSRLESSVVLTLRHFGSVDPPLEPDECCVADVIAFRSVTQHSSGSDDDSVEPKWRHFGSSTDSTEPPQRCVSVRRLGFVFSDNQLRQNTHLSVPTTYVASLTTGE